MTAKKTPPRAAEVIATLGPPRAANTPPVKNPEAIEFQESSFWRRPFIPQSNVEKRPPHTAKFPPRTGARALRETIAPGKRSPYSQQNHHRQSNQLQELMDPHHTTTIDSDRKHWSREKACCCCCSGTSHRRGEVLTLGEFLAPLIPYQTPPPMAPMANEAPRSEKMT